MKNSRKEQVARRDFLKCSTMSLLGLSCVNGFFKATSGASHPMVKGGIPGAIHNMLVVGTETIYLYHLPMFSFKGFDSPHRYQVILEASLTKEGGVRIRGIEYRSDRQGTLNVRMYTFSPQKFVLPELNLSTGPRRAFKGTLFRGHLERGGTVLSKNVTVNVKRVVYFQEFDPKAARPLQLEYLLFGRSQELFLAHRLAKPPDFDQIVSVKILDASLNDERLSRSSRIVVARKNLISQRLMPGEAVSGENRGDLLSESKSRSKMKILVDREIYFEEGELRTPPTFDPTPAELKAGFGN